MRILGSHFLQIRQRPLVIHVVKALKPTPGQRIIGTKYWQICGRALAGIAANIASVPKTGRNDTFVRGSLIPKIRIRPSIANPSRMPFEAPGTRLVIPPPRAPKENRKVALRTEAKMQPDSKTCPRCL